ncbi:MAG: hypothetical protein P4M09_06315 [Devosia sp.]|nr:hypothetical protein [Devosia sp.]
MTQPAHRIALAACLAALLVSSPALAAQPVAHKVGAITWHAARYVSETLTIVGYVLARDAGYVLFSDEPTGAISAHDLPVTGPGIEQLQQGKKYVLVGRFLAGGLKAGNGNTYHLELSAPPVASAR